MTRGPRVRSLCGRTGPRFAHATKSRRLPAGRCPSGAPQSAWPCYTSCEGCVSKTGAHESLAAAEGLAW
eukprot:7343419-Prymnesium_polylepis.1